MENKQSSTWEHIGTKLQEDLRRRIAMQEHEAARVHLQKENEKAAHRRAMQVITEGTLKLVNLQSK